MLIRDYRRSDAADLARLFYETIHSVNRENYSERQLDAWAPDLPDPEVWHLRMSRSCTLVAEENDELVAFAELEPDGHLNMFYCHKDAVGRGVGRSQVCIRPSLHDRDFFDGDWCIIRRTPPDHLLLGIAARPPEHFQYPLRCWRY
jgi:Acetyltransferase (GNAT) domain